MLALAVRWVLDQPGVGVALWGPRRPEELDPIGEILGWHLDAEALAYIDQVLEHSVRDPIGPETDIFLGDSIGEMGLYLHLTEVVFVGRSLTGEGGQNPLEPAMLGCAVLAGRNVQNFRETYQRLLKNGGGRIVRDGEMLIKAVGHLLDNDKTRQDMIRAGAKTVNDMRGALALTVKALEPYINPLTVKARLQSYEAETFKEE